MLLLLLAVMPIEAAQAPTPGKDLPKIEYDIARKHELQPHRRTIPHEGVREGFNQLHLTLTVSPLGDVVDEDAQGDDTPMQFWPELKGEVHDWKFTPFEKDGKPGSVKIEEYIDLVPPERLPKRRVKPPDLKPDSQIRIELERTGCYGTCPSYKVSMVPGSITFYGGGYVAAAGIHKDTLAPDAVRALAQRFVDADFYSMDKEYVAGVTDEPTFRVSVSIDGNIQAVTDYMGSWVGMPAVIEDLEDAIDETARTDRWIEGKDGLVASLKSEKFNFNSVEAQLILKATSRRNQIATVRGLLDAGVPLSPLLSKQKEEAREISLENVGWLTAAAEHLEILQLLMDAGASEKDQRDKDLALSAAARSGNVEAVRKLIEYGANPNVDLRKLVVTERAGELEMSGPGSGSILIDAAGSGKPEMVREILRYHPKLEERDREGKTALFSAGEWRASDEDGDRVECVRLLVGAGANVNARDSDGNTPLHETYLTDVEEELLKLGADVNARNKEGETPIFTTVDDDAIPLFLKYGANLAIRNNAGQTVEEAAKEKGPQRQEALRRAIAGRPKN